MSTDTDPTSEADPKATKKKPLARKKLIAAGAALLLMAGGGASWFMLSGDDAEGTAASEPPAEQVYVDVPEMVVNLRAVDARQRFLKLHFVLVAADADAEEEINARMPAIKDSLQPFLRELRPEDLAGSAAVYRLKEEIYRRAVAQLSEGKVKDVLVQDLIQQ